MGRTEQRAERADRNQLPVQLRIETQHMEDQAFSSEAPLGLGLLYADLSRSLPRLELTRVECERLVYGVTAMNELRAYHTSVRKSLSVGGNLL